MKAKKLRENLLKAQRWYDAQSQRYKDSTTRPGSVKQRVITGNN